MGENFAQFISAGSFDELLLEAIDEAFSTMGNSVREALYFCLEKEFKISRTSIPEKLEDFARALEKIFGMGAKLIENWIIRILNEKSIGSMQSNRNDGVLFAEYVISLRRNYAQKISS